MSAEHATWIAWLAAAVSAAVPVIVGHWLTTRVKRYESQLQRELVEFRIRSQAQTDASLAIGRAALERSALEHQVRFTRLHEKRAEVLSELHEKLEILWEALERLRSRMYRSAGEREHEPPPAVVQEAKKEQEALAHKAFEIREQVSTYFRRRALWVDTETEQAVNDVLHAMLMAEVHARVVDLNTSDDTRITPEYVAGIISRIEPALALLRARFREILAAAPGEHTPPPAGGSGVRDSDSLP